jgi:hypothetical protein
MRFFLFEMRFNVLNCDCVRVRCNDSGSYVRYGLSAADRAHRAQHSPESSDAHVQVRNSLSLSLSLCALHASRLTRHRIVVVNTECGMREYDGGQRSATFPRTIEASARKVLQSPVEITGHFLVLVVLLLLLLLICFVFDTVGGRTRVASTVTQVFRFYLTNVVS